MTVSIKEVARIAGVSTATVSRYLNSPDQVKDGTRSKVQEAIDACGYAPNALARNFRLGRTGLILVVLPTVGDPFFTGVMRGIWRVAKEQHYGILIKETQQNTLPFDEYTDLIFSKQADGIILLASTSPFKDAEFTPKPIKSHPPIILSCENVTPELKSFPSVRIDNVAAARDATEYLLSLGHKRVAFITGSASSMLTADRELGYRQAMTEAACDVNPDWVLAGELTIDGARRAARRMLNLAERPTAIFCANDEMAMGVVHEIKSAGLNVPKDISVVGFDDIRYAEVCDPPLTTVAQPAEEIGERTMYRMCQAIEGKDGGAGLETVPHKLVVRRSTAPVSKP